MDINHPGPFLAHLSKTPEGTDVRNYDGSGEWTKIYTLGLDTPTTEAPCHWLAYNYQGLPGRVRPLLLSSSSHPTNLLHPSPSMHHFHSLVYT